MEVTPEQLGAEIAQAMADLPVSIMAWEDIERAAVEQVEERLPLLMLDPDVTVVTLTRYDSAARRVRVELLIERHDDG